MRKPSSILPLGYRKGTENDLVSTKYSPDSTLVDPVGEKNNKACYCTNFARTMNNVNSLCINSNLRIKD